MFYSTRNFAEQTLRGLQVCSVKSLNWFNLILARTLLWIKLLISVFSCYTRQTNAKISPHSAILKLGRKKSWDHTVNLCSVMCVTILFGHVLFYRIHICPLFALPLLLVEIFRNHHFWFHLHQRMKKKFNMTQKGAAYMAN